MRNVFVFGLTLFCLACSGPAEQKDKDLLFETIEALNDEMEVIEESNEGNELVEENYYDDLPANIIFESSYHGDEVTQKNEDLNWFGLYMNNDSTFYLEKTVLAFNSSFDSVLDDDQGNDETGITVKSYSKKKSVILMAGIDGLKEGEINVLSNGYMEMAPNDELMFKFLGVSYKLKANGVGNYNSENKFWEYIDSYTLTLSATINGEYISQVLLDMQDLKEAVPHIQFIGDIDGDGILDLIIDDSDHYNVGSTSLFLSKSACDKEITKLVANLTTTGC